MRFISVIIFLCVSLTFKAQLKDTTFFDIKRMVEDELNRFATQVKDSVTYKKSNYDTLYDGKKVTFNRIENDHSTKQWRLIQKLKGKDFPDIYYETITGEAKALSDYKADVMCVVFNYAYCQSCLDATDLLLDSLKTFTATHTVKIITLLSDSKEDGENFNEKYQAKVELGFITKEREKDHLPGTGTPYLFVLDRNRKIIGSFYLNDIRQSTKFKSRILNALDKN
jgi:peroxiredoxin